MAAKPTTIAGYLAALTDERRAAINSIRAVINRYLDPRFAEGMQYGMPAWFLPHSEYPGGYHCDPKQPLPFASIASQKSHIGIYLFCIYTNPAEKEQFEKEWAATGKRLNMGASCVRVKKLEDVPLDVLGRAIKRMTAKKFVASYEAARAGSASARGTKKKAASAKKVAKKAPTKSAAVAKARGSKAATSAAAKSKTKTKKAVEKAATKPAAKPAKKVAKKVAAKGATRRTPARAKVTKKVARKT
ncbi:hypothetical protein Pla163_37550 [Planctomycetes bacterium Pla163]|uniref:YdhG-like domain-containing protein n=1 Tax=Rohdeia mirabilis TaxID=2528008 RepID=A0A518D567_9BACT|nr:hypothetical protein Pla163_37550 [Planctomycetes bacterium Pla163]